MIIAIDHDGTYTEDPALWDKFILNCTERHHKVIMVTMRHPEELLPGPLPAGITVIYTSRAAKAGYLAEMGIVPDIWIDDNPYWILNTSL